MSQHPPAEQDSRMGSTYLFVIIVQVVVTIALWWLGQAFPR